MSEIILQRSPEWYAQRLGKFTSSKADKLLGVKGLGQTGLTYCLQLAIEIAEGIDEDKQFVSYDMQHGIETEPYGFDQFKRNKALEFIDVSNCGFYKLNEDIGGSPDGIVSDNSVLEIKCPKDETFFKLVAEGEIDKEYYNQMQHQMWVTGKEKAYFFNYIIHKGEPKWHEILVPRDEIVITKLISRTKEAIPIRDEYVEKILKNRQY